MKNRILVFILLSSFIVSCTTAQNKQLTITNPANISRTDELLVIERTVIENKIGKIPAGKFAMIMVGKQHIIAQYDDTNGDGSWDELAFLNSFKPKEKLQVSFSLSDAAGTTDAVVRAHVRQRKKNSDDSFGKIITSDTMPFQNPPTDFAKNPLPPYLTEGPAWENDKVAFRLYFDTRNGKDIFGKIIPAMVMDTVGVNHKVSYHDLSYWGMDVLHAGKSLGAGSLAIMIKGSNGADSLVRLGSIVTKQRYQVIADGPFRAVFRIYYTAVLNSKAFDITEETSIWGGQYYYEAKLSCVNFPAAAKLVVGIADFYDNKPGKVEIAGTKIFYSFGPQSENKDNLGLGIAVHANSYAGYKKLADTLGSVQNTYIVSQTVKANQPIVFRFYAGWEKSDERFLNSALFSDYLKKEAALFGSPIQIK